VSSMSGEVARVREANAVSGSPLRAFGRFLGALFTPRAWAELLYVIIALPLSIFGFTYFVVVLAVSFSTAILIAGLVLLPLGLLFARALGGLERGLARGLLDVEVDTPRPFSRKRTGFFGTIWSVVTDVTGWRAMAYLLLRFPVAIASFVLTVVFWSSGLAGLSYWFWQRYLPQQADAHGILHRGAEFGNDYFLDQEWQFWTMVGIGAFLVILAPWVTHGILQLDRMLVRGLLGPTSVTQRVRDLETSRARVVDDSAAALRRIERDLHDGAQARLVALAMSLGLAKEELATDGPEALARARTLVNDAHRDAKETLVELRDLARGIHPPALDKGLQPALTTLAARCSVPVALDIHVVRRPPQAIEAIAYYCTAELLTNVVKHSGARRANIQLVTTGRLLCLQVEDDGAGGAVVGQHGSGLTGLQERVEAVDGHFEVHSPDGGPTTVNIELPLGTGRAA
jgi:signal transduction histidine kinase